jgi:cytochrome c peroxidase
MPCNNALLFLPCFTGEPRRGRLRVGTDPGLALLTRKGTGYYKIPSLKGVWYRGHYLHDGSVASLEEMAVAQLREYDVSPLNAGPMTEYTVAVYRNPRSTKSGSAM